MRKVYAVYCNVRLEKEPSWLQTFRSKYDKSYRFHLTLKQAAYIDQEQLATINSRIVNVIRDTAFIGSLPKLNFDKLVLDEHDDFDDMGYVYLFCSGRNKILDDLQYRIRSSLEEFSDYLDPSSYDYEHKFNPHITIARELDEAKFQSAMKELPIDTACTGAISEVIVSCVPEINPVEADKPSNLTVHKLTI